VKDRRKFLRFPVRISACYSEEHKEDWARQCSIVDISREGMGLVVYLKDKLPIGRMLHFKVDVPTKEKSVCFDGVLGWIKALKKDPDYNFKGGIRLTSIDSEDKWALLDYAYETWKEIQEEGSDKDPPSK
jgi:PilZ domain